MAVATSAAELAERELVITRVLNAPRKLVFKAWTDPAHLVRWYGPQGFQLTSCEMDLRPGGAFRFSMRSPEGKDYPHSGVYREVVEPEKLVFSFAWEDETGRRGHETLVTLTLAEQGDKTQLTMRQAVFESVESRDSHEGGWSSALERLAAYVANERAGN
jgi:uncharacterized protein YndB with AHSA1/START domain